MNISELRLKHKRTIVDHAFRIAGTNLIDDKKKQEWINFILSGGDLREMLDLLKKEVINSRNGNNAFSKNAIGKHLLWRANSICNDIQVALKHEEIISDCY